MIILTNLGDNVKSYLELAEKKDLPLPRQCPDCGRRLTKHARYPRWAIEETGSHRVAIQRVRCKPCGKTHAVLPGFLAPYRQYVMPLVERAFRLRHGGASWGEIARAMPDIPLDVVQGWLRRGRRLAGSIAAALARGVRRMAPTSDVDGIFRRETDPLGLLWAAARALWAAGKEVDPGLPLAPERLLELCNAYLVAERTGLWV